MKTCFVPEDFIYESVDASMDAYPEQAVALMVSREAYDRAVRALEKIVDVSGTSTEHYHVAAQALKDVGEL